MAKYIGKLASCEIRCFLGTQEGLWCAKHIGKACILRIPMYSWLPSKCIAWPNTSESLHLVNSDAFLALRKACGVSNTSEGLHLVKSDVFLATK